MKTTSKYIKYNKKLNKKPSPEVINNCNSLFTLVWRENYGSSNGNNWRISQAVLEETLVAEIIKPKKLKDFRIFKPGEYEKAIQYKDKLSK